MLLKKGSRFPANSDSVCLRVPEAEVALMGRQTGVMGTPEYEKSRDECKKVEMKFALDGNVGILVTRRSRHAGLIDGGAPALCVCGVAVS